MTWIQSFVLAAFLFWFVASVILFANALVEENKSRVIISAVSLFVFVVFALHFVRVS